MSGSTYPRRKFGLLMACLTASIWGTLALFLKYALSDFGPTTIVCFRFFWAFIVLGLFLKLRAKLTKDNLKGVFLKGTLCGIFLGCNYIGYAKGVELSGAATTQILIQSASVFFVLSGVFLFKETLTKLQGLGVFLTIGGIFLFSAYKSGEFYLANLWSLGSLYLIYSGFSWALYAIIFKIASKKADPSDINLIMYGTAMLFTMPGVVWSDFDSFSTSSALVAIYLGFATLIAYGSMGLAIKHAPVAEVSMIITANPIITLVALYLLDLFALGWIESERLGMLSYLGAVLTIFGVTIVVTQGENSKKADN